MTLTVTLKFLCEKQLSKRPSVADKALLSVHVMVLKNAKQTDANVLNLNSYAIVDATIVSTAQTSKYCVVMCFYHCAK